MTQSNKKTESKVKISLATYQNISRVQGKFGTLDTEN